MRFRRRIKIAPGVGLNLSGSGIGVSTGLRGLSVSFGRRGIWGYASLPGTGLYQRKRLSNTAATASASNRAGGPEPVPDLLDRFFSSNPQLTAPMNGGPVSLIDGAGLPLSDDLQEVAWKHLGEELLDQLTKRCDEIREGIRSLATLHHATPDPTSTLSYESTSFEASEPVAPTPEGYHWLWRLLPWHRQVVESDNEQKNAEFRTAYQEWLDASTAHVQQEADRQKRFRLRDELRKADIEDFLEWHLSGLQWPQDTSVDLTLSEDVCRLALDIDFPEIEDLPQGFPEVVKKKRELRVKPLSQTAKRRLYAAHVHAVVFRLVGEAFYAAPTVQEVVASGYTQRPDAATGAMRDDYLISVIVERSAWEEIDFSKLEHVDPVEALGRFSIRRKMTAGGIFRAIEPFA
jgi:hypothetical protein